ncbi:MAG: serine O-acetyltransferase [Magnetococcales bacterium]|nr:serine O-acetyltransferase [Magnetococcales bacterium]
MFARIRNDIRVVFARDPAARNFLEVLLCYPGVHALLVYRLAHWLWYHRAKLPARLLSHLGRMLTGIEIHPGARIGEGFFIDHGMGVVIGETTEIGANVTIYHGVTLGGTSWQKGKRHPTLEDNVIVGAGAKILGPVTIGMNARVGSNAVVVNNVPKDTTVVGIPGRVIIGNRKGKSDNMFPAYGHLESMPDPVVRAITCVLEHMHQLDDRIELLEERGKIMPIQMDDQDITLEIKENKSSTDRPGKRSGTDCLQGGTKSTQDINGDMQEGCRP